MTNKEKYSVFCERNYIPIYSKSWWMDAVCGEQNWDVWIYGKDTNIVEAAMPYYLEKRGKYQYITKALLTQNNGIIFKNNTDLKECSRAKYEEKVINAACEFIADLNVDVYEQQYQPNFQNWLPFFWNQYTAITRYTYVVEDTSDLETLWENISSSYRNKIRKGQRNANVKKGLDFKKFYEEHEKIFLKQNMPCPFSFEQWKQIYTAVINNSSGIILYSETSTGEICSVLFLVWDDKKVYQLLGGSMPQYQNLDTYDALIWEGIKIAHEKSLQYDFEGSVIKHISKSFREFGGTPKPYFRIRKVFNQEIMRMEFEKQIKVQFPDA